MTETPAPTATATASPVSAEQFAQFADTTHVLLGSMLLLLAVFVFGSIGLWSRRG